MSRRSSVSLEVAALGLMLRVILGVLLVGVVMWLFGWSESDSDSTEPGQEPSSELPPYLSGSVTGPCHVLLNADAADIAERSGRKVGEAYLYGPPTMNPSDSSCTVEFDTMGDEVPRLSLYVIKIEDLYAEMPLQDGQPVGYLGEFALQEKANG